jgi:methylenetetrahydrofolate reductase (NADPH)
MVWIDRRSFMAQDPTVSNAAIEVPAQRTDPLAAIAALMRGYSLEATRPSEDEIAALAAIAPAGTHVYLNAVPGRPPLEAIAAAARLRRRGFEPVPHLAVRNFASEQALDDFLARAAGEAGVRRVLVIAGDRDHPLGPLRGALEVIDGGALGRHGITGIGIAGYPDGHPRIAEGDLDRALADKIAAAAATGLDLHVVTQFCFDAATILAWIARLRDFGSEHSVRVGLAGPTSLATLLRYAQRCGVHASAQAMARQSGLVRQVFALSAPDALIRALAEARADRHLGEIVPHFFCFGGLVRSARWAQAVAERRIALDTAEGFRVEPP